MSDSSNLGKTGYTEKKRRDEDISLILKSISKEELALADLLRAEGKKINEAATRYKRSSYYLDELLSINKSANQTLRNIITSQILLLFKLDDTIDLIRLSIDYFDDEEK